MSDRWSILDGKEAFYSDRGLVYSEVLGWIDLGHAQGTDIKNLLNNMHKGECSSKGNYTLTYAQSMYLDSQKRLGAGMHVRWQIKRGRTLEQQHSIALAMIMTTAVKFEDMQASPPFGWFIDSGFSAEDLVSDLLGFYRVVRPMNYFPWLQLVSKQEALRRWDHYGPVGQYKNKLFKPLLFPDPAKNPHAMPVYGALPKFMMEIEPFSDFHNGIVKVITNNGAHANIIIKQSPEFE
ncbi:hypothetical protein [Mixta hanseatica]|uniref:DUF4056 domain-containing protein n=1 Tax=Mixta hanseatica TaxID=2872648 RepID=A0ABY4RB62_9GAMM|nr:hypothetical protein [Mixta hanseatica]UQY44687.1 hypothetical protein K6958_03035 [Mixta hanseatica]